MANLVKELKKKADSNRTELSEQSAITETTRLIAEKGAEDYDMLKQMGMHSSVQQASEIHGRRMELENLEEKYGQVFSYTEIKDIACKYALKFLRSDMYKGPVEPVMIQKIKEFFKDSGIEANEAKMGYNFFVLAPPKTFALTDRPVPVPPDPILFYKLDERNYRLIHKWGADLTPWRRILGLKYISRRTFLAFWMISLLAVAALPLWFYYFKWWAKYSDGFIFFPILIIIAAIVTSIIRTYNDDWGGEFYSWADHWTDDFNAKK